MVQAVDELAIDAPGLIFDGLGRTEYRAARLLFQEASERIANVTPPIFPRKLAHVRESFRVETFRSARMGGR